MKKNVYCEKSEHLQKFLFLIGLYDNHNGGVSL